LDRERCHQAAIAVALLEEPFPIEGLPRNPVQQVRVNLRTDWLHKVTRQTVTSGCIDVQDAQAGIKTECGSGKARFRFQYPNKGNSGWHSADWRRAGVIP
jgi:hypothetical protein